MKKAIKIMSLFLFGVMLFSAVQPAYAADDPGLSDDSRLVHIKDIYAKGMMFKARGDAEKQCNWPVVIIRLTICYVRFEVARTILCSRQPVISVTGRGI